MPDLVTGKALVRISRNGIVDQSDTTFSIMDVPQNMRVEEACIDDLTISWDSVPGATSYTLYKLGDRYMDSVNVSGTTTGTIPISDPFESNWIAVSANGPDNACSNRTIAQLHQAGFLNCIPNNDISVTNQICGGANIVCASVDSRLRVGIVNNSMTDASDIEVGYQLNNGSIITENYVGTVPVGETAIHTFSQLINLGPAAYTIKAWVHKADDDTFLNDTISYTLLSQRWLNLPFQEDFPTFDFPIDKWTINNHQDNQIGWDIKLVRGAFEDFTRAAYMNNIGNQAGAIDNFISNAIDLTDVPGLTMTFDVAYAGFNEVQQDTLLIEVIGSCGEECFAETVYYKGGADLSTAPDKQTPWVPLNETQWRHESVDLTPYVGQVISIKFSNISGKGNAMCIDNINLEELLVSTNQQHIDFGFKLAPNPGTDKVNILLSDIQQSVYQLEWYGVHGQLLKQQLIKSETGTTIHAITTSDLPSGVYWIKLIHGTGALTKKWVKL